MSVTLPAMVATLPADSLDAMPSPDRPTIGVVIHRPLVDQLFAPRDRARLESLGRVRWTDSTTKLSPEQTIEMLRDADIAIGSWGTPWPDATVLPACPRLRLWLHAAGTVKRWFGPHLTGRDLTIASAKGAIADGVAEFTIAHLVAGLRGTFTNANANRAGIPPKPTTARQLCAATVGVIGASAVGVRVIRLLHAHGARVVVFDPWCSAARAAELRVDLAADLMDLCHCCDAITLHTPLLDSTKRMLKAEHFQALADDAVIVNTSRGECLDQDALTAELSRGRLTALLDVTTPEPLPADHPLRSLANCAITSHIAGPPSAHIGRCCVDDVAAWLAGRQPADVITAEMLERIA